MSAHIRIHGCPRCGGAIVGQNDSVGEYSACLMCGYVSEPQRMSLAAARAETEDAPPAARSRRRLHMAAS